MKSLPVTAFTLLAAALWLRGLDFLASHGFWSSRVSRKIVHITTGPLFVFCWLLYPGQSTDRYLAAIVPALFTIQFACIGLRIIEDDASVKAMSRGGDPAEILRGPLYYGVMFVLLTILFWQDTPVGIVALMTMCGGDGIADIIGRSVKSPRLRWAHNKSVAGSLAVFLGGFAMSVLVLSVYTWLGYWGGKPIGEYLFPLAIVSLVGMIVESLPWRDVDNITVTVACAATGMLVM